MKHWLKWECSTASHSCFAPRGNSQSAFLDKPKCTHCWGTSGICKNKNNVKISIILVIFEIIQNNVNISNKEPLFDLNVGDISRYVFKALWDLLVLDHEPDCNDHPRKAKE